MHGKCISTKKTPRPRDHYSRIPTSAPHLPSPMPSPSARSPHQSEPKRRSRLPGPLPPEVARMREASSGGPVKEPVATLPASPPAQHPFPRGLLQP